MNEDNNKLETEFLSDASKLARHRDSSEGFLNDLVDLANSEEYAEIDLGAEGKALEKEAAREAAEREAEALAEQERITREAEAQAQAELELAAQAEYEKAMAEYESLVAAQTAAEEEAKASVEELQIANEADQLYVELEDKNLETTENPEEKLRLDMEKSVLGSSEEEGEAGEEGENPDEPNDPENPEENAEEPKKKKKNGITYYLAMAACLGIFFYCVGKLGYYFWTGHVYKKEMSKLSNVVGDISDDVQIVEQEDVQIYFPDEQIYTSSSANYVDEVSDDWQKKYASLVELNSDCVGWIQIPDTQINYPVMYTPGDYEYYLHRDFDKNYFYRGLPFLADGTQLNVSQNTIIYGHNMNDGTAFGNLRNYVNRDYAMEHQYCYFYTAYNQAVYQLMDVCITKIYTNQDNCFKYYRYTGDLSQEEFETYVYYMDQMSSFDTGVDAVWGDELISLSTCYRVYDKENGRLVLVFKRIQ